MQLQSMSQVICRLYDLRLDNDNTYYIELKAVNASGIESDSAVYNAKKAEELVETDKDGNKLYGVKGITVSRRQS